MILNVRLPVIAFEVKGKKDLYFRTYALFSRIRAQAVMSQTRSA